jgi:outer membrane receptor protein involved in Fe transport
MNWRHRDLVKVGEELPSLGKGTVREAELEPRPCRGRFFSFAPCLLFCALLPSLAFSESYRVEGVVHDSSGAAIVAATVTLQSAEFTSTAPTDPAGVFVFPSVPHSRGTVQVQVHGFAIMRQPWSASAQGLAQLQIILEPASVDEHVVVSASRTEIALDESPGSSVLLSERDLRASPSLALDDVLRQVPGFSLFRRTGSRFANPTTLGVSLRGLGASGASRALVLEDGIPLLDPFGGWVYWDRAPREAVAGVEVFRGGSSGLYGSNALGGVIQLFTRQPVGPAIKIETSYGNEKSPDLSLWVGQKIGRWDAQIESDLFRSDGYILTPESLRGAVDTPVNAEHAAAGGSLGYQWKPDDRVFARGSFFADARNNGTPIQTNDIRMGSGAVGIDTQLGAAGSLAGRVYGDFESYNQNFSSIAANRMSEALTNIQHVPAQDVGASAQWSRPLGKAQTMLAGLDFREMIGASEEQIISSGIHTFNNVSGGRQQTLGFFGEDIFKVAKWTVIVSARLDNWWNRDGVFSRTAIVTPAPPTVTDFANRSEQAFSPRVSLLRSLSSNVSVTASGYRSFRAPTLNELYRSFRQGNAVTNNNPQLEAERLTGAEGGLNVKSFSGKLDLRGTYFWSEIVNPIANVTLSSTPALITRQRQNLGRTQSQGLELDGRFHLRKDIDLSGGYSFTDATVLSFPVNTALQGLQIPQVPRQQFTLEARYSNPSRIMLTVQGRFVGSQFDDDQNQLPLGRFFTLNATAARSLSHGIEVFAAAENLLDQSYNIALTPTPNLGPPILVRVGLRFEHPAR